MNGRRRTWKRIGDRRPEGLLRHHRMPLWWVHDLIFAAPVSAGQRDKPRGAPISSDANLLHTPINLSQWELLKNTPVESLHWRTKTLHLLENARCRNLGDVFSLTSEGWANRRWVGKKTVAEIENRIQKLLKIKCKNRSLCDTNAIEQKIRNDQIPAALAEAFILGRLTAIQIRVLELRYGLSTYVPHTLAGCGKIMHRTPQWMQHSEMTGKRRLSRHPEIRRAFQCGLRAIQDLLWRQIAGRNKSLIPKKITLQELHKRIGGPARLLIKVCYGDAREWLNQNLARTPEGWRMPA